MSGSRQGHIKCQVHVESLKLTLEGPGVYGVSPDYIWRYGSTCVQPLKEITGFNFRQKDLPIYPVFWPIPIWKIRVGFMIPEFHGGNASEWLSRKGVRPLLVLHVFLEGKVVGLWRAAGRWSEEWMSWLFRTLFWPNEVCPTNCHLALEKYVWGNCCLLGFSRRIGGGFPKMARLKLGVQ